MSLSEQSKQQHVYVFLDCKMFQSMKGTNASFEVRLNEQGLIEADPIVVEFGEHLQVFGAFLDSQHISCKMHSFFR